MLDQAVQALCEGRADLVAPVKAGEREVNGWEVRIERECFRILALYEPVASDLRRTVSVLRIKGDLERVGDLATKLAKRARRHTKDLQDAPIPDSLAALARGRPPPSAGYA